MGRVSKMYIDYVLKWSSEKLYYLLIRGKIRSCVKPGVEDQSEENNQGLSSMKKLIFHIPIRKNPQSIV